MERGHNPVNPFFWVWLRGRNPTLDHSTWAFDPNDWSQEIYEVCRFILIVSHLFDPNDWRRDIYEICRFILTLNHLGRVKWECALGPCFLLVMIFFNMGTCFVGLGICGRNLFGIPQEHQSKWNLVIFERIPSATYAVTTNELVPGHITIFFYRKRTLKHR